MKSVGLVAFAATCLLAGSSSAQNGGREGGPTYAPPPPTTAPTGYAQPGYTPPPYSTPPPPSGPKTLPYDEGDPVPPGYHVVEKPRTGLIIGGGVTFGVFYGITAMAASGAESSDAKLCYIPIAGPVLYGNTIKGDFAFVPRFFLWIDALAQTAGAVMLAVGSVPKTQLVRNDWAVRVSPVITAQTTGLALTGSF